MTPAAGVSTASDLAPAVHPTETFAKDAIISWFRGEFAAANAIIDALCGHLSRLEGGRCEYESVFAAIHRRRINWIPILQMQKYFSIADVTLELQKVTETKSKGVQKIEEEVDVSSPLKVQHHEIPKEVPNDRNRNQGVEAVDDGFTRLNSPTNEIKITDTGSEDAREALVEVENIKICSNQEDWEVWRAQIKMTKGFVAKESVKGHMVNVVRGLKLYENILTHTELTRLNDYVNKLRVAGKNGQLSGETFIIYNQQSKAIKRELIQFGAPIFGQIKAEATSKSQDSHIEPIPDPLEGVIDHLIKYHLIPENRRPNSCIINFFDEGEFSQPFLKPPHLDQPISTLVLSESTMAFGRTLVCDKDGNYKGPLMLSLNQGSLLLMRGNSADMARHVMCQSPTKRISLTFFKVRTEDSYYEKNVRSATSSITMWQPNGNVNGCYDSKSKWDVLGAPQLVMLAPVNPMVLSLRRWPHGGGSGTGVFLPWSIGSQKPTKHLPRVQRGRLTSVLALPAPSQPHTPDSTSTSSI
ncbi:unnamed protein product [Lactuca virosa]|uniref:Fe2OG dioxygenase domain-containing protein n=1 Tax=Lactuca virosa TaxID=75947 RepID=A0AAU9MEJ9_9ASTR|nr:unnamed protein product [Lactuca virosa]